MAPSTAAWSVIGLLTCSAGSTSGFGSGTSGTGTGSGSGSASSASPTAIPVDDAPSANESYPLDGGLGAMSTAGTSRLLQDYPEPLRSHILDYLFKPNFGASMQHLKVALGGDGETTCGSEPTTMRSSTSEDYQVGYEMWLMAEAKRRNPDILLYGLPLSFPAWVADTSSSSGVAAPPNAGPYGNVSATATYVTKWCLGAKKDWNLTIDYVGLWNERPYTKAYILELRRQLNAASLQHVKIIGSDARWDPISTDVLNDPEIRNAVDVLSAHYPGTQSSPTAKEALRKYKKPLWNVEEFSTFSDETGGLCWIRCVVDDYINGLMTMTSSWHLIGAFYPSIAFWSQGMLTAVEPWSGNYHVNPQVWMTAHMTQFTSLGDRYLPHGAGSGKLASGGSYVSLVDGKGGLTILIQKASHENSRCIRPALAPYTTTDEEVVLSLRGNLAKIKSLSLWMSHFPLNGSRPQIFEKMPDVAVVGGQLKLTLLKDAVYTLSNRGASARKGQHPPSPPSSPFPLPYKDSFDECKASREAKYFSDFSGAFECHGGKMRQMTPRVPIGWMQDMSPLTVIGSVQWEDVSAALDLSFSAAKGDANFGWLGVRLSNRGDFKHMTRPDGAFLSVHVAGSGARWVIADTLAGAGNQSGVPWAPLGVLATGALALPAGFSSVHLELTVQGNSLTASIEHAGTSLLSKTLTLDGAATPTSGWVGMGSNWDLVDFDNFAVAETSGGQLSRCLKKPEAGQTPITVACGSAEALDGMRWDLMPGAGGTAVKLRTDSSLCLEAVPPPQQPPLPPPPPPLPPVPPGTMKWSAAHHASEITLSQDSSVASWDACDKVVLLGNDAKAWQSIVWQSNGYADIGFCSPSVDVEGPWLGFQAGKAWVYRAAGGLFKAAANDAPTGQGKPYGKPFGKGDNITSIRHSDTELEFVLNGKSQGIIKLEKPIPSDAVGCASMCAHAGGKPAILSLHGGPVPPPQPPPPKLPVGSVRLATCDSSNPRQRFVYDQEARSVSYRGQCLSLQETALGSADSTLLPDPTAFSAVVLGGCPAVDDGGELGSTDLSTANSFTWSPELGFLRSAYASCNLCIGMCGHNATAG